MVHDCQLQFCERYHECLHMLTYIVYWNSYVNIAPARRFVVTYDSADADTMALKC